MARAYPGQSVSVEPPPAAVSWKGPFLTAAMGTFMATLDGSIVSVALPSIAESLHAPVDEIAWVMLAYTLTLVSLMIVFGAWIDRRGYRFGYRLGFFFFLLGSIGCSFATSLGMLIVSRIVQGIGTAIFSGTGPGLVATIFPEEKRGRGIGMMIMTVSAGFSLGFPLGGIIVQHFPWQTLFWINVPIGLAGFFLVERFLRPYGPKVGATPIPLASAAALAVALVSFTYSLTLLDKGSDGVWMIVVLLGTAAVAGWIFFRLESNPQKALLGFALFRKSRFRLALASQTTQFIGTAGAFFLLPFYFRQVRGFDTMTTGLFLLTLPLAMFVAAPLAGRITDRIGARLPALIGIFFSFIGLGLTYFFDASTAGWFMALTLGIIGLGSGAFGTPNATDMMSSVDPHERAAASSILATNRNIGMAMGVALSSGLFAMTNGRIPAAQITYEHFHAGLIPVLCFSLGVIAIGFVLGLFRHAK